MSWISFLLITIAQISGPRLVDGQLIPLSRTANLASDITRVGSTGWVGYSVPAVAEAHGGCSGVVDLARGGKFTSERSERADEELYVFLRSEAGRVVEIRSVASGCRVRTGGEPVHWLSPVSSAESVAALRELVRLSSASELGVDAVNAIARHAGSEADEALDAFADERWPRDIREKAIFWMGAARGERGFRSLLALSESTRERALREKIVFALHVSDAEGATESLIAIARADGDPEVREKALFWLGQEAGERASRAIAAAVREDPDVEVKKKAVFALSQLPPDEGVPLLVEIAETHRDPEVRKKAFFWLGQSGDPRALALFERVLSN